MVVFMTSFAGDDVSNDGTPQQSEVSEAVEEFVSGTFCIDAKRVVDDPVFAVDEEMFGRRVFPEASGLEHFNFLLEDEGSTESDFADEGIGSDDEFGGLSGNRRVWAVIEFVFEDQLIALDGEGDDRRASFCIRKCQFAIDAVWLDGLLLRHDTSSLEASDKIE